MKRTYALLCLLLCLSMLGFSVYRASAQPSTSVAVDPPVSTVVFGSAFGVNVNVTNIVNFTCWQLNLYYLNSVLNCTNAVEGPFLNWNGAYSTYFSQTINNNYNSTYGCLLAYCTLLGMDSVNGSGVILTVSFKAVGAGNSYLTLANTVLGDTEIPAKPISHVDFGGVVNVTGAIHDVAVTNVVSDKTVIEQGYGGNIIATAANLGGYTETFNVTVYANRTVAASQNVTLSNANSASVTFVWNTTGFAYGNYTISAYAWPVPGETNIANNNCTGGWVIVAGVGDLTGSPSGLPDGVCDISDVAYVASLFGMTSSKPGWKPNADFYNTGVIDISDVALVAAYFGKVYPYPPYP